MSRALLILVYQKLVSHAFLQYLRNILFCQIQISCRIDNGGLRDARNHFGSGTEFTDGEWQTNLLHPIFQGL